MNSLLEAFGSIDIYLFDQLLKGRLTRGMRVLDAGCGTGRNQVHLLRAGFDVSAVDADEDRLAQARRQARRLAPALPRDRFQVSRVESLPFPEASFDFVISSAVLHFAADEATFDAMLTSMWRVLAPGGVLFARLASDIGLEQHVTPVEGRRYRLPDGSERFLVDQAMLLQRTERLGGSLLDPIKTTVVQDMRSMTTWVVGK